MRIAAGLMFVSLLAIPAQAQLVTISTIPPHPVANTPFIVRLVIGTCTNSVGNVTVNGTNLDFPVTLSGGCFDPFPPITFDRPAGPLPAGSYTIRALSTTQNNAVIGTAPLVIGADVPALDRRLLALLAIALVALATLRLR